MSCQQVVGPSARLLHSHLRPQNACCLYLRVSHLLIWNILQALPDFLHLDVFIDSQALL